MPEQEAEQTNLDSFIEGTYQRENALNAELDYLHKARHEIEELKGYKEKIRLIEEFYNAFEGRHITEVDAIERIKTIVRG